MYHWCYGSFFELRTWSNQILKLLIHQHDDKANAIGTCNATGIMNPLHNARWWANQSTSTVMTEISLIQKSKLKRKWEIPSASDGGKVPPEIFPCTPDGGNVWRPESTIIN